MKKIAFVFVCMLAAFQLSAQQLPNVVNPGFEDWDWNIGMPVGWATSCVGTVTGNSVYPVDYYFATQTTDAHSGNYAMKLKGVDPGYSIPYFPGLAQLGHAGSFAVSMETAQSLQDVDFDDPELGNITDYTWEDLPYVPGLQHLNWNELSTFQNMFSRGDAFNMVPTAMKVWVKYLPEVGVTDTMKIMVGAYKAGEECRLIMGIRPSSYGEYVGSERITEYTELTIPIDYDVNDVTCDSIMIMFVSTPFQHAKLNTELYVDDISFEFDYVSVRSSERIKMQIYPNPACEYLTVSVDNQAESYDVTIYDMNGKLVKCVNQQNRESRLYVGDLSAGTYFLKVKQDGNETARKFVVE